MTMVERGMMFQKNHSCPPFSLVAWAVSTLLAGCTEAPTKTAQVTAATAPDLSSYIGKTCSGVMGPQNNIDDYVKVNDKIFVRHRHGRSTEAEDNLGGGDALRQVGSGRSGWPYEFTSDSGAQEFPKPGGDPQHISMRIDYQGVVGFGTYDCQPSSPATSSATTLLSSQMQK